MFSHLIPLSLESAVEVAGTYQDSEGSYSAVVKDACCDPFFRVLDRAIRSEHVIRERAIDLLHALIEAPWRIGGPNAQDVERASACRIIRESFEREDAEIARAVA